MSQNKKQLDFVKGDLVYFIGYEDSTDYNRIGIVYDIKIRHSHFPLYEIYWFKDKLSTRHTASHIDLVYTKSITQLSDRVNDRGEGD